MLQYYCILKTIFRCFTGARTQLFFLRGRLKCLRTTFWIKFALGGFTGQKELYRSTWWILSWLPLFTKDSMDDKIVCGGGLEYLHLSPASRKRRRRGNTVSDETVMYGYWSSVTRPVSDCTVSYRPVFSSERAPYRKNNKAIVTKEKIRITSGHGP
jgi:hypothetical protein